MAEVSRCLVGLDLRHSQSFQCRAPVVRAVPRRLLVAHFGHSFIAEIFDFSYVLLDEVHLMLLRIVIRLSHIEHLLQPHLVIMIDNGIH